MLVCEVCNRKTNTVDRCFCCDSKCCPNCMELYAPICRECDLSDHGIERRERERQDENREYIKKY